MTLTSDMTRLVQSMSLMQINSLSELLEKEKMGRKTEVKNAYGEDFCRIVTVDKICSLVQFQAKDLKLENDPKYPQGIVLPSMLEGHSAVRGLMGSNRPFVAIKIDILDSKTRNKIDVVVEVIFKRYSANGCGSKGSLHENNYVTALGNQSAEGKKFPSFLYSSGGMRPEQMQAVKDLLDGKTIIPPLNGQGYLIKMSK